MTDLGLGGRLPAGMQQTFVDRVNDMTRGSAESIMLRKYEVVNIPVNFEQRQLVVPGTLFSRG
jgi:hypothetical protein